MFPVGMQLKADAGQSIAPADEDTLLGIEASEPTRMSTGIIGFDRVLGGGIVIHPPCVIQFGSQPGLGKSTLLLQAADHMRDVLYTTSEETLESLAMRAKRLKARNIAQLRVVATRSLDVLMAKIKQHNPQIVICDSLQKMRLGPQPLPGEKSPKHTQYSVLEVTTEMIAMAQKDKRTVILVNHVNKEEDMAGLKEIEHDVDVVMWFKGERSGKARSLTCEKNRFGGTAERAMFVMEADGLHEGLSPDEAEQTSGPTTNVTESHVTDPSTGRSKTKTAKRSARP